MSANEPERPPGPRSAAADLRVCAEATPFPWRVELSTSGHYEVRGPHQQQRSVARVYCDLDAAFLTLAREALPWWIAEALRLRAELPPAVQAVLDAARAAESADYAERSLDILSDAVHALNALEKGGAS